MQSKKSCIVGIVMVAAVLVLVFTFRASHMNKRVPTVIFENGTSFAVTIADTDAERTQGLSNSQPLESNHGMLFIFDQSDQYGFWMQDMNYPIDIIWMDEQWRVVHIVPDADPSSYPQVLMPDSSARYVLEIPAGSAREYGIQDGNTVVFHNR